MRELIPVESGGRGPESAPHSFAPAPERLRLVAAIPAQQRAPALPLRSVQLPEVQTAPLHAAQVVRKVAAFGGPWRPRQAVTPADASPMPGERHRAIACRTRKSPGEHFARQEPACSWRPVWAALAASARLYGRPPSARSRLPGLWVQKPWQQPVAIFRPPARL